jgi:hypothetical protein
MSKRVEQRSAQERRDRRATAAWWLLVALGIGGLLAATVLVAGGFAVGTAVVVGAAASASGEALLWSPSPPAVGAAEVTFVLHDASVGPIQGGTVRLQLAPEGQWERRVEVDARELPERPGHYRARVLLTEPGPWTGRWSLSFGKTVERAGTFQVMVGV